MSESVSPIDVVEGWNQSQARPKVKKLTDARRAKLVVRLKDSEWPWREAIGKLPIPNTDRFRWQPDFDWLIANDTNALKLVEGKYQSNGTVGIGAGQVFDETRSEEFGEGF